MNIHCVPLNDERKHNLTLTCWCEGEVDWLDPETGLPWANGGYRVIHNAEDCREVSEELTDEGMEGKEWILLGDDGEPIEYEEQ